MVGHFFEAHDGLKAAPYVSYLVLEKAAIERKYPTNDLKELHGRKKSERFEIAIVFMESPLANPKALILL